MEKEDEFVLAGQYIHLVDDMPIVYMDPIAGGRESLKKDASLDLDPDNILIATFPKSGTIWTSEIINLLLNGGDVNMLKTTGIRERITALEIALPGLSLETTLLQSQPRLLMTHLFPQSLLRQIQQNKAKIVVVMRNPKDVLVSFYHFYHCINMIQFPGSWNSFFKLFKKKKLLYGDVFDCNLAWWKLRNLDNVFIMKYEDMKKDLGHSVQRLAKFLGRPLTDELLATITEATSFKNMKDHNIEIPVILDPSKGSFMRKGEIGDWVNYFSEEQSIYVDTLYRELLVPEGLGFDFQ